jgi:hypothetical protein
MAAAAIEETALLVVNGPTGVWWRRKITGV